MRGVVFNGDRDLEIAEFDDPAPGPDDAVVAMKASGMCGSDLRFYRAAPGAALAAFGLSGDTGGIIAATNRAASSSRSAAMSTSVRCAWATG